MKRPIYIAGLVAGACVAPLVYRELTSRNLIDDARRAVGSRKPVAPLDVRRSMTIQRSREDVYAFWRRIEALPNYMEHLDAVDLIDDERSRWTIHLPGMIRSLDWMAEMTADEPGSRIAWKSLPGGDVAADAEIRFEDAPGDDGTVVHVRFAYRPSTGRTGRSVHEVFTKVLARLVREDIRRVKHVLEAGEIPTNEGQPAGQT